MPQTTPRAFTTRTAVRRLELMLDLARAARDLPEREVIEVAASTMRDALGYQAVVFNAYRPAEDDYEVVLTLGDDELSDGLLGSSSPRAAWDERLFLERCEVRPGVYFQPAEEYEPWDDIAPYYVPDMPASEDPSLWHPLDSLLVRVATPTDEPLGAFSIDMPESGLRPRADSLAMLAAVRDHVSLALETARMRASSERQRRDLTHLVGTASRLTSVQTTAEVASELCVAASTGLDFQRAIVYRRTDLATLGVVAVNGWWPDSATPALRRPLPVLHVAELLRESEQTDGCSFLDPGALRQAADPAERAGLASRRRGNGPLGWGEEVAVIPMRDEAEALVGLLAVEDPTDRLRPTRDRIQALRLLAQHAQSALVALSQREELEYQATHDPLTGLRNRRGLEEMFEVDHDDPIAVLVFDLDRFKRVNDMLGHEVGDVVLQRFAEILREHARSGDVPLRLGGEEFCLVARGLDEFAARGYGERVRRATITAMEDLVPRQTVSVGVAVSRGAPTASTRALLTAADAALYSAKSRGRNRVVVAPPTP